MKNDITSEVALKLGVSKTTVGKVYRHCSGVDSETRQLILDEFDRYNIHDSDKCDIYCIIPDTPQFFWQEMRRGIRDNLADDLIQKFNIITKIHDENTVLSYLKEAEEMRASVIIITANLTPKIQQQLTGILSGGKTLVILLSEFEKLTNSFYIGSDSYSDGFEMGKLFISKYSYTKPLLLTINENTNAMRRIDGFKNALSDAGFIEPDILEIPSIDFKNEKLAPAHIAALLSPYKDKIDFIYSPVGFLKLPLAVHKAKFPDNTVIFSHDCFSSDPHNHLRDGFTATMNQDIYTQGKEAILAALRFIKYQKYPPQKFTYIPSVICC